LFGGLGLAGHIRLMRLQLSLFLAHAPGKEQDDTQHD
jgi:hypothetical protein